MGEVYGKCPACGKRSARSSTDSSEPDFTHVHCRRAQDRLAVADRAIERVWPPEPDELEVSALAERVASILRQRYADLNLTWALDCELPPDAAGYLASNVARAVLAAGWHR